MKDALLVHTNIGLYCPQADLYIDPHEKVERAVFTHAHADHAREGCLEIWAHQHSLELLKARWLQLPENAHALDYCESFKLRGVKFSLHSAGHILGSSQILIEAGQEKWLVSGDYKRAKDPSCPASNPWRPTFS